FRHEVGMATHITFQQPQAVMTQQVIQVQSNQWSTGITDCCSDMSICCCAIWCFHCFACKTSSDFGECFCLPLLQFSGSLALRVAVRERYHIQGSICCDCMYVTFCDICSWCQIAREIKKRKAGMTLINVQATSFPPVVRY
ncbi:CNFN protein, partial [Atractosteus spatula]|nr:CNFN protein [Atractosteus spatula]